MSTALVVPEKVDRIKRLHQDPPVEWSGETAWSAVRRDGETILQEHAFIECPDCDEQAFWINGRMACSNCETRKQLRG